jgi:hypothetical protein
MGWILPLERLTYNALGESEHSKRGDQLIKFSMKQGPVWHRPLRAQSRQEVIQLISILNMVQNSPWFVISGES